MDPARRFEGPSALAAGVRPYPPDSALKLFLLATSPAHAVFIRTMDGFSSASLFLLSNFLHLDTAACSEMRLQFFEGPYSRSPPELICIDFRFLAKRSTGPKLNGYSASISFHIAALGEVRTPLGYTELLGACGPDVLAHSSRKLLTAARSQRRGSATGYCVYSHFSYKSALQLAVEV